MTVEKVNIEELEATQPGGSRKTERTRKQIAAMVVNMNEKPQKKATPKASKPSSSKKRKAEPTNLEEIYEIEKIMDSRTTRGKREFLVKWVGYPQKFNTWEPESNFLSKVPIETFDREQKSRDQGRVKKQKTAPVAKLSAPMTTSQVPEPASSPATTPASNKFSGKEGYEEMASFTREDLQNRLLRRSVVEQLLCDPQKGNADALMEYAPGLFVRLKVDSHYQVAQILELQDLQDEENSEYLLNNIAPTTIYLMVSLDKDNTVAKVSYISDGESISEEEFLQWKQKLETKSIYVRSPPAVGNMGNLERLTEIVHRLAHT